MITASPNRLRHLTARARVDRWLHHPDGRRRLAGLLAAPLLALLALSISASPAAAECNARPGAAGATVFVCEADEAVVFGVTGGLLRHNRKAAGDPGFEDEFDFDTRVTAPPGSQPLANDATSHVQVFGNISNNQVTIGDASTPASTILAAFTLVSSNDGSDQLTIDNTANTAGSTISVSANGVVIGLGGVITYGDSGVETLSIKSGGGGDTIFVFSTVASTNTVIEAGGGNDTFNIGNSGTLDGILGPLTVAGDTLISGSGTDQLNISEHAETAANTYTLTGSTIQRAGAATIAYIFTSRFSLTAGSGGDTLTIDELPGGPREMTMDLGDGNDRIIWDTVNNTSPAVNVEGGSGSDTFQFNAPAFGTQITTLDCTGRLTFGQTCTATTNRISIGTAEQVVVNGSPVQDSIQVTATPGLAMTVNALGGDDSLAVLGAGAGSTLALDAGEGNDFVIVGSPTSGNPPGSALAIQVPVTVDGGLGTNRLTVNRGNGQPVPVPPAGASTVTVSPTQVGATAGDTFFGPGGRLAYAGFQTLFLNGYDVDDTVRVTPSATTEISIRGNLQTTADTLDVDLTGTTGATLDLTVNPNELRFADRRTVSFTGFENKLANGQPIAGLIQLGAASVSVDENSGPATITVTRSSAIGAASVQLATSDGTANGGVDYAPATLTVQFAPGETSKTVTIAILNDTLVEGQETVNLTLSSVVGLVGEAALGPRATSVLQIRDDDAPASGGPGTPTPTPPGPGDPGTPTPTPPVPGGQSSFCAPRPNIQVTTTAAGNGLLRVTLRSQTLPATPSNALSGLRVVRLTNAQLTLNGQPVLEGQTLPLAPGTQEVALTVQRLAAGQASTAHLVVTDVCGEWPTFVGGGPGAF